MARGKVVSARLEGMDELERRLRRMVDGVQKEKLTQAAREGAEVLLEFQQALAPVGVTGRGKRNLAIEEDKTAANANRFDRSNWRVGPSGEGYYLIFHEIGTRFMAPSPFMRPALDSGRPHIIEAVRDSLRKQILKAVR